MDLEKANLRPDPKLYVHKTQTMFSYIFLILLLLEQRVNKSKHNAFNFIHSNSFMFVYSLTLELLCSCVWCSQRVLHPFNPQTMFHRLYLFSSSLNNGVKSKIITRNFYRYSKLLLSVGTMYFKKPELHWRDIVQTNKAVQIYIYCYNFLLY